MIQTALLSLDCWFGLFAMFCIGDHVTVIAGHFVASLFSRQEDATNPCVLSGCSMLLLGVYAYGYGYDNELWSSWSSVMSSCVTRNKKKNHDVSKERSASEVLECTYQPLNLKALCFFGNVGIS
jgi:hypothetical protein